MVFPASSRLAFIGLLCLYFVFAPAKILAQQADSQLYRLWFADKGPDADVLLHQPASYMSGDALAFRYSHQIPLDEIDLPVYQPYLSDIEETGARILQTSRWLNTALVQASPQQAGQLLGLPGLLRAEALHQGGGLNTADLPTTNEYSFGTAASQLRQLGLDTLQNQGWDGSGVRLAIFDSGFPGVNTGNAYQHLRDWGLLKDKYDFVANTTDDGIYGHDTHGTECLSVISAIFDSYYRGAAPWCSLYLARSENKDTESPAELDNWVAAAEWAHQRGVQIISSSLVYNTFDNPDNNLTYSQMDGNTTVITRGADLAASRGILVVNAAGNEGNAAWRYIMAPCDGDSVLCVGAVRQDDTRPSFSCIGPSADGRTKPDVMARGQSAAIVLSNDETGFGNGTSYAAPMIAGLAACLWQAFPSAGNMDVLEAIKQSADRAANPDNEYGWGVPSATAAFDWLSLRFPVGIEARTEVVKNEIVIYKNGQAAPAFAVMGSWDDRYSARLISLSGQAVWQRADLSPNVRVILPEGLESGIYTLHAGNLFANVCIGGR